MIVRSVVPLDDEECAVLCRGLRKLLKRRPSPEWVWSDWRVQAVAGELYDRLRPNTGGQE